MLKFVGKIRCIMQPELKGTGMLKSRRMLEIPKICDEPPSRVAAMSEIIDGNVTFNERLLLTSIRPP